MQQLVDITNELLGKANIRVTVRNSNDINASIFVSFLEHLCDESVPDIVREPKTEADEIHNMNIVLSMLSRSLKISLSHISAEDVVAGSVPAIWNLIEIFSGIMKGDAFDSSETSDEVLINLANSLLEKSEMALRVKDICGINSSFFVQLLTGLCQETIPGFIASPETLQQEEQNVRLVLQILEGVLNLSLSHINAKDIVNGNNVVTKALLDIFSGFIDGILANESSVAAEDDKDDQELVTLANHVVEKLEIRKQISKRQNIDVSLFVQMFEQLCSKKLSGVVREPKGQQDNVHNMEIVIKSLQESLNMSLSHIQPQGIVEGDRKTLKYLLNIFAAIVEGNLVSVDVEPESEGKRTSDQCTDDDLVKLANVLLTNANLDSRVKTLEDINASFFVLLLEELCGKKLSDFIRQPQSDEDNVYNLEIVIKTLSKSLNLSLSHISAVDVNGGKSVTIKHLLQVFHSLVEGSQKKTANISEKRLLKFLNQLLAKLKMAFRAKSIRDINSSLFVNIVEQICNTPMSGVVRQPSRAEDDIQNVRAVISTLERSLGISLSFISAAVIVSGNRVAIHNLVEVLSRVANEQERRLDFKSDIAMVKLANEVLVKIPCKVNKVESLDEVNASYFMSLLEHLCKEQLSDFIRQPNSRENDIHNMRVVVNTLSDILMTPLSHIKPREVVLGNRLAVGHLLEVFHELPTDFDSFVHQKKNDAEIIVLANEMLEKLHMSSKICSFRDINASVFVTLFEGLCAETLPDVIRHPRTKKDEVHNVNLVIEALSSNVLSMSLSHITGQDIVAGDRTAISNLLEVFHGLMEFILEEIRDEGQRELHVRNEEDDDDPDCLIPEAIDRVLRSSVPDKATSITSLPEVGTSGHIEHSDSNYLKRSAGLGQPTHTTLAEKATSHGHDGFLSDGAGILPRRSEFRASVPQPEHGDAELHRTLRPHTRDYLSSRRSGSDNDDSSDAAGRSGVRHDDLNDGEFYGRPDNREMQTSYSYTPSATISNTAFPKSKYVSFDQSALRECRTIPKSSELDERISTALTSLSVDGDLRPSTYEDYLMKYYGRSDRPRVDDTSYLSDSCVDYDCSSVGSHSGSFERELESCRRQLNAKAKAVRFDDYLDECATGSLGEMRRQFRKEEKDVLLRKELLGKVYHDELFDQVQDIYCDVKKTSKLKDKEFQRKIFKPPPIARYQSKKYSAPKSVLLPRSRSGHRPQSRPQRRSASASPSLGYKAPLKSGSRNILPELLDEFPFLHLTPATLSCLYRRASQQVDQLSRAESDAQRRKTKAQEQIEDAERRQRVMIDIMQKDLDHQQRLKETNDRKRHQLAVKSKLREKRLQTARIRKYYDDFHVRQRSRLLKKRTKEELIFRNLFHDGLDIQKDRIREIRKYAKEQREQRSKRQKEELESLENFYRDQFMLLAESLEAERCNTAIRDKAQTQVLEKLKQEMRKKMEKEIRDFQQRLFQDEDDIYYRGLDAERIKQELRLTQYHHKI